MFRQLQRQYKKWWPSTTTKISIYWSLVVHYETWQWFFSSNLSMQKVYPFTEGDKDRLQKFEMLLWSIYRFYTRSSCWWILFLTVYKLMQIFCWGWWQPIIAYSMCRPMPTDLYAHWDINSKFSCSVHTSTKPDPLLWIRVMSYLQRTSLDCKIESLYTTGRHKKNDRFNVDRFPTHWYTLFEAMGYFHTFIPVKACVHLSLKKISNVAVRKKNSMIWDETI